MAFISLSQENAKWIVGLIIAGLGFAASTVVSYFHNDKELTNRVTAVESKQNYDHEEIHHTREQVDKLVDLFLGKK